MIDKNKKIDQWGPVDAVILYFSFWLEPTAFGAYQRYGAKWPEIIGILENRRLTFYWERQRMNAGGFEAIEKILLSSEKRRKLWESYKKVQKDLKELADKIDNRFDSNRGFDDITLLAVQWSNLLKKAWEIGIVPELANFGAPDYLKKKLEKFVPETHMSNVLEILLAPEGLSFHQESEKDLFMLAVRTGGKPTGEDLRKYAGKWNWVENSYYETKNLPPDYFLMKMQSLKANEAKTKLSEINGYLQSVRGRKKEIAAKFGLGKEIKELSKILAYSIWWQDSRKGLAWWAAPTIDKLSKMAEKALNIPLDDILMYTSEEWANLFKNRVKLDKDVISERNKLTVFDCTIDGVHKYYGKEAMKIKNYFSEDDSIENSFSGELKGIAVSKGITKGKVRILLSSRNLDKMKKGDVLVAPMTSPDYILAMRRASAIITDVGGLMSHAAIVSRELGIPCVVGTKIATKVLKDGDLVEVDAENGVVTIIKKSQ